MAENEEAFNEALRRLSYRLYSSKEIKEHLIKKGFSEADIKSTIDRLLDLGYLNDMEFVRSYVSGRGFRRKMSLKALIIELKAKVGNQNWLYDKAAEFYSEYNGNEEDIAKVLLNKKLKGRSLDELDYEEKQKIKTYLMSKGFDYNILKKLYGQ